MSGIRYSLRAINIDVINTVVERTFLSPFFTFWIPVIAICQNSRSFFNYSSILFLIVFLRSTLKYLSRSWFNKRFFRGEIDWSDQLVLVTGGSDGLGRVLVETLLLKHVSVIVLDIVPFSDRESEEDGDVIYYRCDVSDPDSVREVSKKIRTDHGSPTILINNAGIVRGGSIIDLEPHEIKRTFGVNTLAHFYLLKEFLPDMIKRNSGHIVTISSTLGQMGVALASDYCASKAATTTLHRCLRQELSSKYNCDKVRTTLVCPGKLSTKMFQKIKPQNQFFFPEVSTHDLTKKILKSINDEESEEIFLPIYTSLDWLLRVLPYFLIDAIYYFGGSNDAMDELTKFDKRKNL